MKPKKTYISYDDLEMALMFDHMNIYRAPNGYFLWDGDFKLDEIHVSTIRKLVRNGVIEDFTYEYIKPKKS